MHHLAKPVRIAIIGCGAVSENLHAPILRELEKRNAGAVVAIADPNGARLEVAGRLFPAAQKCESVETLLNAGCEIALVASPLRFHAEHVMRCVEAGLSVLCEKPMAASSADAEAMMRAARTTGRLLAVGHVRRFFPSAQVVKQLIQEKRFGELVSFQVKEGGAFMWPAASASFFDRATSRGGVLMDNGIHALDLLLWWFGEPRSFCYEDDAMGGIETNCRVRMDYGSFQGYLQLSWDYEMPNGYHLEFERARVYLRPYEPGHFDIGLPGVDRTLCGTLVPAQTPGMHAPEQRKPISCYHCNLSQWLNVIAAVRGDEPLRVPGEEAIKSVAFVEKCYAQRTFMEPPWFTDEERMHARELNRSMQG